MPTVEYRPPQTIMHYSPEEIRSGFKARWEAMELAEKLKRKREEDMESLAAILMQAGFHILPSQHLLERQIVVSEAVYEAAKRIVAQHVKDKP